MLVKRVEKRKVLTVRSPSSPIATRSQRLNDHSSQLCCAPGVAAYTILGMRTRVTIFALVLTIACYWGFRDQLNAHTAELPPVEIGQPGDCAASPPGKIDFTTQVQPIFESTCQPCHFNGGKMYQRLPFDRPETIRTLGAKLFSRIKNEHDRQLIRDFLSQ
jgi:hypothetical protein